MKLTQQQVGFVLAGVIGVILLFALGDALDSRSPSRDRADTPARPVDSRIEVVYKLTGTADGADLTYTDSAGNIQQQTGVKVPLKTKSGAEGLTFSGSSGDFVQFSAQNQGDSGNLQCTIEADGRVINTGNASGGYAIVSCSASLP